MPRYMLDTNICIYLMKHQPEAVAKRFAQCMVGDVVMSAITFAELFYGVSVAANPDRERHHLAALVEDIPVLPFDGAAAKAYGPVREASRERRKDQLDKLIASHAVSLDVTLITNNERDFTLYPGLRVENWLNG
ncbi:type II toxin-antitoxin system VapC family toxin [Pandoraea pulmonicola]|uniref:Ribonuclease VapC n=1 Tax=Pandoraea pulmonicola TaxID=93221 RepID=A0AAJ4ZCR5_PANPU|nr:type II toxin-antitoxin system VapC family toxin [Pandoraea pulmonicola]AJC20550.1 twitching motility protein PilT [Pandoraea pulmonicola]SUA91007.1 tRNA(fMet)-specific endonuclease VapC [Pandoraea pulmonicola]